MAGDGKKLAPVRSLQIRHKLGLDRAYETADGVHVSDGVIYIAGTRDFGDVLTDVGLPLFGSRNTRRYEIARAYAGSPVIHTVVGHSLGGHVAHEIARDFPQLQVYTYGAPLVSKRSRRNETRIRDVLDPVSVFDYSATTLPGVRPPHSAGRRIDDYYGVPQQTFVVSDVTGDLTVAADPWTDSVGAPTAVDVPSDTLFVPPPPQSMPPPQLLAPPGDGTASGDSTGLPSLSLLEPPSATPGSSLPTLGSVPLA